jgi:MFS family permease
MRHHHSIHKPSMLYTIGVVGFFTALHASLPNYFNSGFLSTFVSEKTISLIYLLISLVTIIFLLSINTILRRIGNLRTSIVLILLQIGIFYGIITSENPSTIIILFILGMSVISLISLTIDIFLQKSTDIGHTGSIRGFYMTAVNMAWIFGPLLGGMLINGENYKGVYIGGFAILFPLLYLIHKNYGNFKDSHYVRLSTRETFIRILKSRDISKIFIINIILQTFYAWMTVYTPLYLHNHIGFNWAEISLIFTIMLIPFVLVEIPLGKIADKRLGEKEIMAIGFVIMGLATVCLILFPFKNLIIWALMLFITRLGAAAAEIMIETYFFKKIDGKDPEMLSMFRITRPLSFFTAPVLTTIGLVYVSEPYLFVLLGATCLLTVIPILRIRDTL